MMSLVYRLGDVSTPLGPMRLTVSGLAEVVARCDTPDLLSLADQIRVMTSATARHVAMALLRPCGGAAHVDSLSDAQVAALMPAAARCITDALTGRS
ncbi:MAG: hypothetical protein ACSHX3_12720 [Litorimonas sp.]